MYAQIFHFSIYILCESNKYAIFLLEAEDPVWTWDSRTSQEDMEEMWKNPSVSKEWIKSGEKRGKVRFSHDAEKRPYLSRVEVRVRLRVNYTYTTLVQKIFSVSLLKSFVVDAFLFLLLLHAGCCRKHSVQIFKYERSKTSKCLFYSVDTVVPNTIFFVDYVHKWDPCSVVICQHKILIV